jgi:hypothetical protein
MSRSALPNGSVSSRTCLLASTTAARRTESESSWMQIIKLELWKWIQWRISAPVAVSWFIGSWTQTTDANVSRNRSNLGRGNTWNGSRVLPLKLNVLELIPYLLPLASKTSFTEWYAKPLRSTNSHLLALLCHFGLQQSRNFEIRIL